MPFFPLRGKPLPEYGFFSLLRNGRTVVGYGKKVKIPVLTNIQRHFPLPLLFLQGSDPVVNQIGEHLTQLPGFHLQAFEIRLHFHIKIRSVSLGRAHLCHQQGIDRRYGSPDRLSHLHHILVNGFQVIMKLLILLKLHHSVYNLKVI